MRCDEYLWTYHGWSLELPKPWKKHKYHRHHPRRGRRKRYEP